MPIEATLIKPVVDALMGLFRQGDHVRLKRNAEAALREAIRELLLANPDENKAAARIAIAKAAGILSEDVMLAEDMLRKHRNSKSRTCGKTGVGTSRKRAAKGGDDKGADKRAEKATPPPKKGAPKKSAKRP